MKKYSSYIIPLLILALAYWFYSNTPKDTVPLDTVVSVEQRVGADRDAHGCIGSAGYTWCEAKQECLREWEEPCIEGITDEVLIKQALMKKHNWEEDDIRVTVSENTGMYATGGVVETASQVGGAMWLAAKTSGNWEIIWDGNGTVMCSDFDGYEEFPIDMMGQCYDEVSGTVITR